MNRVKSNGHYLRIFALTCAGFYSLNFLVQSLLHIFVNYTIPGLSLLVSLVSAILATRYFLKSETRYPENEESSALIRGSFFIWLGLTLLFGAILSAILWSVDGGLHRLEYLYPQISDSKFLHPILLAVSMIGLCLHFLMIYLGVEKFRSSHAGLKRAKDGPLFPQDGSPASAATADGGWKPVDDRSSGFAVREERAPWLKWAVGLIALGMVGGGAIWLASKVVIADDVPTIERAEKSPNKETPQAPKSEDDLAWVKALEVDTVEGYRAYIADFPNGRHVEDAQRLINEFDEEAWKLADERDTLQGYEDYLESWPEGLHATEAKERIAKIKAEEEARRKNAAEAARQEAAAWQAAAKTNTIPSYEGYLEKYPTGKNASEAQTRIDRLRAEAARQQAAAADEAAWQAAVATDTGDAYQQYRGTSSGTGQDF